MGGTPFSCLYNYVMMEMQKEETMRCYECKLGDYTEDMDDAVSLCIVRDPDTGKTRRVRLCEHHQYMLIYDGYEVTPK